MPAMLDDPTAPAIYRVSGPAPYPGPFGSLPPEIVVRQVTLRDRVTIATLIPFSSPAQVPPKLTAFLCELLGNEIEKGDTYPMMERMPLASFGPYWFANFAAVMIMGELQSVEEVAQMEQSGTDWSRACLGSFYVKPNYPGRSSHVCNGGFLVSDVARNRGVGRLMGECYLEWAPKLGYSYSVFNLVYETNVASLRIWDALGFKRIGRVKGCGNLKSYPDQYVDAIIFGRELGGEDDEFVTEERFDKIRYYLKHGTYPKGSDRAEKSRLRSAATHYRLVPGETGNEDDDKLMLKGKEVVSDPHKQYEITKLIHAQSSHGGINKTTAGIAEKYHWVRIKETVSAVIRNCTECKDPGLEATKRSYSLRGVKNSSLNNGNSGSNNLRYPQHHHIVAAGAPDPHQQFRHQHQHQQTIPPMANMGYSSAAAANNNSRYGEVPVDPQLMQGVLGMEGLQQQQQHVDGEGVGRPRGAGDGDADDAADRRLRRELEAAVMGEGEGKV